MDSFEKNITFVIVSFKSNHIIERCIKSIKPNVKIKLPKTPSKNQVMKTAKTLAKSKPAKIAYKVAGGKVGIGLTAAMLAKDAYDKANKKKKKKP